MLGPVQAGAVANLRLRVRKELRELLQQVAVVLEELGHLRVHLADALLLLLVCVQDLQERLVRVGLIGKARLRGAVRNNIGRANGHTLILLT